jgi:hypothetical protein
MILQLSAKQLEALIDGVCEHIGLISLPLSHKKANLTNTAINGLSQDTNNLSNKNCLKYRPIVKRF